MKKSLQLALIVSLLALILLSIPASFMISNMNKRLDELTQKIDVLTQKCDDILTSLENRLDKIEDTLDENYPPETIVSTAVPDNHEVSTNTDTPISQESEVNNDTAPKQLATYDEATHLPWTQILISGEGTYRLENNSIVKYSNDERTPLSGGTLDWSGMDTENYRPYDTEFCYDETNDILYLIASSVPYDFSNKELKDNVGVYLYSIPDRSKSEIKFISQIKYTETGNDYIFDESTNPVIKDRLYMEGIMEIEFDWWCTFADGYIHTRAAFPEGTFTHPVTTTPSVPLSAYQE